MKITEKGCYTFMSHSNTFLVRTNVFDHKKYNTTRNVAMRIVMVETKTKVFLIFRALS